jgi:signal transduction histidine kinase/CheY-like chemotaxis protein/HPt (histidine-containing phosphotransfer) domain-containing protein
VLDINVIKSVLPGLVEMNVNTAIGFLLAGMALWATASTGCSHRHSIRTTCGLLIIALGLATAFEYLSGSNLGIDELLFHDALGPARWELPPGRMALVTAIAFVMIGGSLLLLHGRATIISQLLACATVLMALFSLAGYLCQEVVITAHSPFTSLALHTAVGFTAMAVGLLAASPPRGPVAVLVSATRSGALARLLLPAALGVTLGLGGIAAAGQRAGWYEPAYGIALYALTSATVMVGVIWYVAHRALLSEEAAKESGEQVLRLNEVLEQRVVDRTADLVAVTDTLRLQINERQRAEEALHHSRAQLLDTIESLDAGLVVFGPDERMVVCNNKYKEIYSHVTNILVHGNLYEDILRAYFITGAVSHTGLSEEDWVGERLHTHRNPGDSHEQWLSGRWIRISDRRTSDGGIVSLRTDITTLKQAQEAAEAANRAKSEFLANMSHEIRTPMNGILGMTELTLDSDLTRVQRENLGMVKTSADSLLRVINDILDFSKIEAGMLELDPLPFALRDSLSVTMKALGSRAHEKGLELICHIGPDVPDAWVGDSLRLRQIVTNLIGNAIKFTAHGEVALRVEVQDKAADVVCLHFTARDTGIGIPADKLKVIFEAFTQADASTTRVFGGTGLGLAITTQLVALMGGDVWVESTIGAGSTFHFTVRLAEHAGSLAKLLTGRVDLEGLPVLDVDDNATNSAMMEEVLTAWGMRSSSVSNGISAIAAMKRAVASGDPFPLILLDAFMPGIDGFAVAELIKSDPELAGATIMMLSSADHSGDASRCRELGVACYLRKPITQSELFDAILTAIGAAPLEDSESPTVATVGAGPGQRPIRILLAEDNEINQELAIKTLEKRGHTVFVAGNGREAFAAFERESVDIVLMDVQMPEMDGFAATAAIREREKAIGTHVPIVALTAHAMKGDRERCLAAGMDAYVTKPLRVDALFEAIARLVPSAFEAAVPVNSSDLVPTGNEGLVEAVFDQTWALARVEGDGELLRKIIGLFFAQTQKLLPEIRSACERSDGNALERIAHKLQGSMGSFAARRASEAALRLEIMGRNWEFVQTEEALAKLEYEVARLREALTTFTEEGAACAS